MRGQEGLLGAVDVALAQPDPSELAQRPSHLTAQVRAQLLTSHQRLLLRLVARPAQPQDLRAVHATAPMEAPDRIRPAPSLHRFGPLLGDVVLRESLQGADELAVHQPGRERIELPGDRRHSHLVEQRQAFRDIAVQDAQPSCRHLSDGAGRSVASRAHRDGALGPLPSAREVAGQHPLVRADGRKPRVRGRLLADPGEAVLLGRASRAPAPSARCPAAGASRREPLHLPPRQRRRPAQTARARAPMPRWSRRDGRPRKRPRRATADRPDLQGRSRRPPSAGRRPPPNLPALPPLARAGRSSHAAVTATVTAVSKLLTHLG